VPSHRHKRKSPERSLSQAEIDLWRTLEALHGAESILDWIPLLSPTYEKPRHIKQLLEVIWRMQYEPVYAWCSVPPRFSKTESIMHSVVWRLMQDPTCEIAYCTYEADLAYSKSRKMRELAEKSGVQLKRGSTGVKEWWTVQGGRVICTSVGGPITGKGCKWLIIDDSLKNREEAESPVIRKKQWDWFTSTALSRVEPGGSVLVNATRWHDDDLIGRIIAEFCNRVNSDPDLPNWIGIHMPAIFEDQDPVTGLITERSLWPSRWSVPELRRKRRLVGEYDWASLYQGQPRPKGGRLFKAATRYQFPMITEANTPYKIIIGADPAATEKTSSDYSCAVVMAVSGEFNTLDFRGDILEVYRKQVEIPEFVARLRDLAVKWGAPIAVESVAGFKAVPQMLRNLDKRLHVIDSPALGDKFTRALPVSAAWNDRRIRVPGEGDWIQDFLNEVEKFTGVKDAHDDQVDALAHAYNCAQMIMPQVVYKTPVPIRSGLPFG
jgi:predicted phage terminase large subunit-like protein